MDKEILLNLRKFLVPEIVYGRGAIGLAGRHSENLGASKVLLVTDPGVRAAGWTGKVESGLKTCGIPYVIFDRMTENPKDYEVMEGAAVYREEGCDLILATGGGSPMDCAKGIGVVAGNGGNISDFKGVDEVPRPGPPLIFIPTTAGTSADVSQFAIIRDSEQNVKIAVVSKMVIPDISLVDPETCLTMPPELTAATGMDALCHAFEAYVSTASSPLTDMAALRAAELIAGNLESAYQKPADITCRDHMMMASLMAGLAFSNASLGLVHAMAHSLGGGLDLAHGECNAVLLEKVVGYNFDAAAEKYTRLFRAMEPVMKETAGSVDALRMGECIRTLRKRIGITDRLSDMGVRLEDIPGLARSAFRDPCLATNPKTADEKDIETIYKSIYQ
jgi:alcohol dehydrogenase class IV